MELRLNIATRRVFIDEASRTSLKRKGVYPVVLKLYDELGVQVLLSEDTPITFQARTDDGELLMQTTEWTRGEDSYSGVFDTRTSEIDEAFEDNPKAVYLKGVVIWGEGNPQSDDFIIRVERGIAVGGESVTPSAIPQLVQWESILGRPDSFPPLALTSYAQLLALTTSELDIDATIRNVSLEDSPLEIWQLKTYDGVSLEDAFLKLPDDHNQETNNKAWIRIS